MAWKVTAHKTMSKRCVVSAKAIRTETARPICTVGLGARPVGSPCFEARATQYIPQPCTTMVAPTSTPLARISIQRLFSGSKPPPVCSPVSRQTAMQPGLSQDSRGTIPLHVGVLPPRHCPLVQVRSDAIVGIIRLKEWQVHRRITGRKQIHACRCPEDGRPD